MAARASVELLSLTWQSKQNIFVAVWMLHKEGGGRGNILQVLNLATELTRSLRFFSTVIKENSLLQKPLKPEEECSTFKSWSNFISAIQRV